MTPADIVSTVESAGVVLYLDGASIRFRSPSPDLYSTDLRALVAEQRPGVAALLLRRAEALALRPKALADLPLASTLTLEVDGVKRVLWTTSPARARASACPVFTPLEYEAACDAAEEGRAHASDFVAWSARKLADVGWRLAPRVAFGGSLPATRAPKAPTYWSGANGGRGAWLENGWTLDRVLAHFEARVVDVEVEEGDRANV